MASALSVFSRTIGQKFVMGLTGLFLVSFLLVHLSGNLQLFYQDNGVAFNTYTKFMTTNPIIKVMEWVLFAGFIVHIVYAVILTRQNQVARPERYAYEKAGTSSPWFSRNMGLSGSIVFIFLAVHLYMFWGVYHFGGGQEVTIKEAYEGVWKITEVNNPQISNFGVKSGSYLDKDSFDQLAASGLENAQLKGYSMYEISARSFKQWWIVLLYVAAMVLLGFHLNHGFQSAFRTLGLVHAKYTPLFERLGLFVSVVFPLGFALMPLYFFFLR